MKTIFTREEALINIGKQGELAVIKEWARFWTNGNSFYYDNEETQRLGEDFFIEAKPDGSEYIVKTSFDDSKVYYETIR